MNAGGARTALLGLHAMVCFHRPGASTARGLYVKSRFDPFATLIV
jgi:hypothetical protein